MIANSKFKTYALVDGICFGGGAGMTFWCDLRIVTDKAKWAMPEAKIGFFPDVGASWFLRKLKSLEFGLFIGMTGMVINADDMVFVGAADCKVESLTNIEDKLEGELENIYDESKSKMKKWEFYINWYFNGEYKEIMERIAKGRENATKEEENFLRTVRKHLNGNCPKSMMLSHKLLKIPINSLEEGMEIEAKLARKVVDEPDFATGIKRVLLKEKQGEWEKIRSVDKYFT